MYRGEHGHVFLPSSTRRASRARAGSNHWDPAVGLPSFPVFTENVNRSAAGVEQNEEQNAALSELGDAETPDPNTTGYNEHPNDELSLLGDETMCPEHVTETPPAEQGPAGHRTAEQGPASSKRNVLPGNRPTEDESSSSSYATPPRMGWPLGHIGVSSSAFNKPTTPKKPKETKKKGAASTAKLARGTGYKQMEQICLIKTLTRYLPIGRGDWETVKETYNSLNPEGHRTTESLNRNFAQISCKMTMMKEARRRIADAAIRESERLADRERREEEKAQRKYDLEQLMHLLLVGLTARAPNLAPSPSL